MARDDGLLRVVVVVIALIILLPMVMMLFMWPMAGVWGGGHMWTNGMWNGGVGVAWMALISWLLLFAFLIGGAYLLFRLFRRSDAAGTDPALEELRVAYARGDLTDEEFEQRQARLRGDE